MAVNINPEQVLIEELKARVEELEGFRNECERQYQEKIKYIFYLRDKIDQYDKALENLIKGRYPVHDIEQLCNEWKYFALTERERIRKL